MLVTEKDVEAYRRDGVVCLRQVYSPEWIARMADYLDDLTTRPSAIFGPRPPGATQHHDLSTWLSEDFVFELALEGPGASVAQQMFGSQRVSFYNDQIFVKEKLSPDPTPWHHDGTFWPISGDHIGSLWASVDPIDADSSALEFVAGSHLWGNNFRAIALEGMDVSPAGETLEDLPDIDGNRDAYDIKSWSLEPGDALFFHSRILHGARGNQSQSSRRRALVTRWCGDDARFIASRSTELWDSELQDGEPFCSPLYPQILPHTIDEQLARRRAGPIPPNHERVAALGGMVATAKREEVAPDPAVLAKLA